jgi:hypothetical protein
VDTTLDVRPGSCASLVVRGVRPEGHDAEPIEDVSVESAGDGALTVRVAVSRNQPAGMYNGLLVDAVTGLPRGTLSVMVYRDDD